MADSSPFPVAARMRAATEALYREFAGPRPAKITGCPCCTDPRDSDALLASPLRAPTGDQLWRYVSGAFLTVGGEEDFRYLLPRIFDLTANDPENLYDPETVLGKLARANWRSWRDGRQRAVEAFVDAWFESAWPGIWKRQRRRMAAGSRRPRACSAERRARDFPSIPGFSACRRRTRRRSLRT